MRCLTVLTYGGAPIKYTIAAIESIPRSLEVLVVSDSPSLDIALREFCKKASIGFLGKTEAKGLTDSWNMAYRFFESGDFNGCILANDDVKFADGSYAELIATLDKFDLVGPLSNSPGPDWEKQRQRIEDYLNVPKRSLDIYAETDAIQRKLIGRYSSSPYISTDGNINGFCLAFSRDIAKFKFDDNHLFNPTFRNVGNEDELCQRILAQGGSLGICRTAFVFHWKSRSFGDVSSTERENFLANRNSQRQVTIHAEPQL